MPLLFLVVVNQLPREIEEGLNFAGFAARTARPGAMTPTRLYNEIIPDLQSRALVTVERPRGKNWFTTVSSRVAGTICNVAETQLRLREHVATDSGGKQLQLYQLRERSVLT